MERIVVDEKFDGCRIDVALSLIFKNLTRTMFQKLISDGNVFVNEKIVSKNHKLKFKDLISINFPQPKSIEIVKQNIPIEIVYEDSQIVVVNKPKGMVVHPAPGHSNGTLVNALLWHCNGKLAAIGGETRPGIVHRIDQFTSGLLIVAKTDEAYRMLAFKIKNRLIEKIYEAIVVGEFKELKGEINAPIGRNEKDRKKMAINKKNGKEAITQYELIKNYGNFAHVKLKLLTGRTHQIRVHLAAIGHPIVGDFVYGFKNKTYGLKGQCLHAKSLKFNHPITGEKMFFNCEIDKEFKNFLEKLN